MEKETNLSFFKKWWISIRPFSLPASTMPVIFGTVLAVVYGGYDLNIGYFVLAFLGMVILHAAANILSDIYDFQKGLDVVANPVSGGVVRGIISKSEARKAAYILFAIGTIVGLTLRCLRQMIESRLVAGLLDFKLSQGNVRPGIARISAKRFFKIFPAPLRIPKLVRNVPCMPEFIK